MIQDDDKCILCSYNIFKSQRMLFTVQPFVPVRTSELFDRPLNKAKAKHLMERRNQ